MNGYSYCYIEYYDIFKHNWLVLLKFRSRESALLNFDKLRATFPSVKYRLYVVYRLK